MKSSSDYLIRDCVRAGDMVLLTGARPFAEPFIRCLGRRKLMLSVWDDRTASATLVKRRDRPGRGTKPLTSVLYVPRKSQDFDGWLKFADVALDATGPEAAVILKPCRAGEPEKLMRLWRSHAFVTEAA